MGRKTTAKEYRARFMTISRFVDWKPPKSLTYGDKQRITKAHNAIARLLRGGGAVVRSKSAIRMAKANKIAGLRVKGLKVAFVRNSPAGAKVSLDSHGQAIEKIGGIRRVTLAAEFFMLPDLSGGDDDIVAEEARIRKLAKVEARRLIKFSKGATIYALKYSGGEGSAFTKDLLEIRLVLQDIVEKYNASAAPIAIVASWLPRGNKKLIVDIKDKQKQRRKKAKKRW